MACCILGAIILSALFRIGALLRRLLGFGAAPAQPDPSSWRPGIAAVAGPAITARPVARPLLTYIAAPVAIVGATALAFQTNQAAHDTILRSGLALGVPLAEFVSWCGL